MCLWISLGILLGSFNACGLLIDCRRSINWRNPFGIFLAIFMSIILLLALLIRDHELIAYSTLFLFCYFGVAQILAPVFGLENVAPSEK